METRRYWPFPVLPESQRTEHHRRTIEFLDWALAAGHLPWMSDFESFGLGHEGGRTIEFVHRGRSLRWEPFLGESGRAIPLNEALGLGGCIVLEGIENLRRVTEPWLAGLTAEEALAGFERTSKGRLIVLRWPRRIG